MATSRSAPGSRYYTRRSARLLGLLVQAVVPKLGHMAAMIGRTGYTSDVFVLDLTTYYVLAGSCAVGGLLAAGLLFGPADPTRRRIQRAAGVLLTAGGLLLVLMGPFATSLSAGAPGIGAGLLLLAGGALLLRGPDAAPARARPVGT